MKLHKLIIIIICLVSIILIPSYSFAANFFISPVNEEHQTGEEVTFSIYVNSEDQSFNAISGELSITTGSMNILSISTTSSIIPFWIQAPSFSNGIVHFEGIVPNPGFIGSSGKIIDITLSTISPGTTTMSFTSGDVLANDGLATPILTDMTGGFFVVKEDVVEEETYECSDGIDNDGDGVVDLDDPGCDSSLDDDEYNTVITPPDEDEDDETTQPVTPSVEDDEEEDDTSSTTTIQPPQNSSSTPEKKNAPSIPVITSNTHPDENSWYANGELIYDWNSTSTIEKVRIGVTQNEKDLPKKKISLDKKQISKTLKSGVWYVHVQVKNDVGWSRVANYRVNVDLEGPTDVSIWKIASEERAGSFSSSFMITAKDDYSGLSHFKIKVDEEDPFIWIDEGDHKISLGKLSAGEHTIAIDAFDNVGNSTRAVESFSFTPFDPVGIAETIVEKPIEEISIGPVIIPVKPEVISITSYAGFGVGVGQALVFVGGVKSFADIWFLLLRLISFIASFFRKRKNQPWGVVYDSVTKQPLDPAYVVIKEKGKQKGMAITDLDGRYGFLIAPGKYSIEANKTHYVFPSKELYGKKEDELYDNLYFGEEFDIKQEEKRFVRYNIPLDPVGFDWNEFAKKQQGLFVLHTKRKRFVSIISNSVFYVGFLLSTVFLWNNFSILNIIVFSLYAGVLIFQSFWKSKRPVTKVMYKNTKKAIPFAIIKAYLSGNDQNIKTVVADDSGRFYLLTPPGEYYFTVEVKMEDGSYSRKYKTESIKLKKGVVLKNLYVNR